MKRFLFTSLIGAAVAGFMVACSPQTAAESAPTDAFSAPPASRTAVPATPAATVEPVETPEHAQPTAAPTTTPTPRTGSNAPLFYYSADGHLYRAPIGGGPGERLTLQPLADADDPDAVAGISGYRPPRVSPDGHWLALNGNWGGAAVLDLAAGEVRGVGRGQAMAAPSWSPDSRYLSYITPDDRLCIYDRDGGPDDCPFQSEGQQRLQDAVWSPGGSAVAVAVLDPPAADGDACCRGEVWLVDAFTGEATPLGDYTTGFESVPGEVMAWAADGSGLVIRQTANGRGALYTLADGTLTYFDEPVLSVGPDGRTVLHPSGNVSRVGGGPAWALPDSAGCDGYLSLAYAWSPDGGQLAYAPACLTGDDAPPAERILYVVETATGNLLWQQALSPAMTPVGWSPAGDQLLLQSSPGGMVDGWSIWRMAAGGEQPLEKIVDQALLLEVVSQWRE